MDKKTLKNLEGLLGRKLDQKLKPVNSKLDALTLDIIDVQKKTDAIADIHDLVRDASGKVNDHEQRIQTLNQFPDFSLQLNPG